MEKPCGAEIQHNLQVQDNDLKWLIIIQLHHYLFVCVFLGGFFFLKITTTNILRVHYHRVLPFLNHHV